jgi:hypothetical protein
MGVIKYTMNFISAFLLILLFFFLFIIISVLGLIRSFFGFGKRKNRMHDSKSQKAEPTTTKTKIFDKKEGEYVDFEEMD